ncbi:Protein of unknown function [Paenibacillus sophorae]|uniref:DUF3939 domain-containing protein n=1 Tax=Paenibacillus sophorae TaxID=1333845 RepID=A0A1H8NFD0_9BACL|nr:DUF3939 domain-containing protein [Paenibacillus sophorae]SEO28276.1 Protein of unknown function [Paenibacillus sophorae]
MGIIRGVTLPPVRAAGVLVTLLLTLFLSGCLYTGREEGRIAVSYREEVSRVQSAVDDFYQEEGLLPILNADRATPRFEKFRIDLDKLNKKGYLDDIPAVAFEKGGSAYFLLLDEERSPTVKVMDLVTVQAVNDVQRKVNLYRSVNNEELPAAGERYPDLYKIDGNKAGTENQKLTSVYSGVAMDFIMDKTGVVYADYAFDIMSAIDKTGVQPAPDEDLRSLLLGSSWFVPVKSLPYYWVGGQPVPRASSEEQGAE